MKNNCNVARDLMPLVIDGVASEESKQYVDEHVAECTECAITYGEMRVELPLAKVNAEKERAEMERTAKKVRRRRFLRRLLGVVLAVGLLVGAAFAWKTIDYRLTEEYIHVMPLDEYMVTVAQTKAGNGIIAVNLKDDERRAASVKIDYDFQNVVNGELKKTLEIRVLTTALPQYLEGDEANKAKMLRTMFQGTIIDGEWSSKESWQEMYSNLLTHEPQYAIWDEIVVISDDERKVIYTKGDNVPLCSEEMEAYYAAYHDKQPTGKTYPEWRVDLVKLLDEVPELQWESEAERYKWQYVCENGDLKLEALYYDVSRSPDSMNARVQTDIYSFPSGNPEFDLVAKSVTVNDNTGICVQYHAVFEGMGKADVLSGRNAWFGRIEDGQWLGLADDLRGEDGKWVSLPVVRIELHAGDDYVVLWQEGDELQTPAEAKLKREQAMEQYK